MNLEETRRNAIRAIDGLVESFCQDEYAGDRLNRWRRDYLMRDLEEEFKSDALKAFYTKVKGSFELYKSGRDVEAILRIVENTLREKYKEIMEALDEYASEPTFSHEKPY